MEDTEAIRDYYSLTICPAERLYFNADPLTLYVSMDFLPDTDTDPSHQKLSINDSVPLTDSVFQTADTSSLVTLNLHTLVPLLTIFPQLVIFLIQ